MKKLACLVLMGVFCLMPLFSVNYYSRGSSPTYYANGVSSWSTNRDGSGTSPSNFTTAGQLFYVQNTHSMTATAKWTVSGTGSYVVVENGGTFVTGLFDHQINGAVLNGGTYEVTNTTYSNLGWGGDGYLEDHSNFVLNNASIAFNDRVSYGNLIVKSGTADCTGSTEGFMVRGELRVNGGSFEGGQTTEDQVLSIANIYVQSGTFYGSAGGANVTFNDLVNITVDGGTFLGSNGSGRCVYNMSGDLLIKSGAFYGSYRNSQTLAYNDYNIGGSFTKTGGNYYAVNTVNGGYPSYYLSGTSKNLGLGDLSEAYKGTHFIEVSTGGSYALTNHIAMGTGMQFYVRGTLDAGASSQIKAIGTGCTFRVHGTMKTANSNGLFGTTSTTFSSTNSPAVDLWSGCTIEYNSASAQAVTTSAAYTNLTLSGAGTKTVSGATTVATAFSIGSPLSLNANTTSNGSIAVNSTVTLGSGIWLYLNGSMSGSSSISGGNLNIGGGGTQLSLVMSNVNSITLNRSNGSLMSGDLQTGNLILTNGTFSIGSHTLTINGSKSGSGILASGSGSSLVIGGSDVQFPLPAAMVLHTLTLNRISGCSMGGTLSLVNLVLTKGALNVGENTLNISGTVTWETGTLNMGSGSTLIMGSGASDGQICPVSSGTLTVNRSGKTISLGGSTQLLNLNLNSGMLSLGANTLTINTSLNANGGTLSGGSSSNLLIGTTATIVSLPSVTLGSYNQLNSLVTLTGSLTVNTLAIRTGTLNLSEYLLTIQNMVSLPLVGDNTSINGTANSGINYISTMLNSQGLPQFSVGSLNVNSAGGCITTKSSSVSRLLSLYGGTMNPNGLLTLGLGTMIARFNGSLTSAPFFSGDHQVIYQGSLNTGFEISATPGLFTDLSVMGAEAVVNAQNDIYLSRRLMMGPHCTLNLQEHSLYLDSEAAIQSDFTALLLGNVIQDIGGGGFNAAAAGLKITPGVEISDFACNLQPASQNSGGNTGILRTWTLEGYFTGQTLLTLSWDPSADNGIVFTPFNRAIVFRKVDGSWQQVGEPQDVSMLIPRSITVGANHFSEWTVSSEDTTLPVELSSFTAVAQGLNSVTLSWITQSESGMLGYYLFRNTGTDFSSSTLICQLIPAENTSTQQVYSFTDTENLSSQTYYYWLQSVELNGATHTYDYLTVQLNDPGDDPDTPTIPIPVLSIYPNPFSPNVNIRISQNTTAEVDLRVYDTKGRLVRIVKSGYLGKGNYLFNWDSLDQQNVPCASGIYLVTYKSGGQTHLRKVTLLK